MVRGEGKVLVSGHDSAGHPEGDGEESKKLGVLSWDLLHQRGKLQGGEKRGKKPEQMQLKAEPLW